MHKLFVAAFSLALLGSASALAQTQPSNQSGETTLNTNADNSTVVSYEERLKLKRSNTDAIDMKLKNLTKGEIKDLIKNMNQAETKAARLEGRTPDVDAVNPSDKKAVREFLQKDLFLDPYPRLD